jgi:hypothetical protein
MAYSKYRNTKTTVDGLTFDSKREAGRWFELRNLESAGFIKDLKRQVPIQLFGADDMLRTRTGRKMFYRADFTYHDNKLGVDVVEDAKGFATDVYLIKRAILAAQGVEIKES